MAYFREENEAVKNMRTVHFSRLKDQTYLDHAGAALYSEQVLVDYMEDLTSHLYSNPHSGSVSSQATQDIIDKVRFAVLEHFDTNFQEYTVIFTSGATASMKLLAESFRFQGGDRSTSVDATKSDVGGFFFLNDNHTSVLGMREVARDRGARLFCLSEQDLEDSFQNGPGVLETSSGNNLFAFPAQSNFCGRKYPLEWIKKIQSLPSEKGQCFVFLDAAGFVSSSPLSLEKYKPDFVALSFYKMFGFPTGLGALLVRNISGTMMQKTYFGGGTLQIALPQEDFHAFKNSLYERYEDGTINYLDIIALKHAMKIFRDIIPQTVKNVSIQPFILAKITYTYLIKRCHGDGKPIAICYVDEVDSFESRYKQGPIVAFNILGGEGEFVGYSEVSRLAALYSIHLRTGCFCNLGDCQKHLGLSSQHAKKHYQDGHVCGDDVDILDGRPTGAVRVSFGYYSTMEDVKALILFVEDCFVEGGKMDEQRLYAYVESMIDKLSNGKLSEACEISCEIQTESDTRIKVCNGLIDPARKNREHGEPAVADGRSNVYVEQIYVYPVKSCGAFNTSTWELGPKGLLYDREWMIVDETGSGLRQGKFPQMACIRPFVDIKKGVLQLECPGFGYVTTPLEMPKPEPEQMSKVKYFSRICTDTVESYDCGRNVSDWLCRVLGSTRVHLVRQCHTQTRCLKRGQLDGDQSASISLANEAQYLLISKPSVKAFHDHMLERGSLEGLGPAQVPNVKNLLSRFRANIVIDGDISAYIEERWESVRIGETMFHVQGQCKRCQVICTDQETGVKNKEVYKTLSLITKRKGTFGILLNRTDCKMYGKLSVGDNVIQITK